MMPTVSTLFKWISSIKNNGTFHCSAKLGSEKEMIQHRIHATDAEIDRLVYELYGLTEEEIAIVEGKSG
ncbi:MAG: hypothetical protein A4E24_01567 [Methanomethylovorans sp. PtaU1.Bin093]|uniref:hypothetical protein n=1 Tax=Methanomethylovorans sp. PtaU1.Bin093 TaxID=1811679 RepID=UPI0009C67A11|nr:hypothetical protein [Methanomethylovorans sp. PtaU1.Bin093]OPY19551.1 MAG: hypothetical protein A4E24_01567 [Methanomethylovorans sp. PtaU1.Bin093]